MRLQVSCDAQQSAACGKMEVSMDIDDFYENTDNLQNTDGQPDVSKADEPAADGNNKKKKKDENMTLYDWVQCLVGALVIGILVFMFVGRVIGVDGTSMYPTLHDYDKLIISNVFYKPDNGDIVVLQTDTFGEDPIVKRVIATEGQTVDIDFNEGIVYVDGVALDEPYVNSPTNKREDFNGAVTVPEGCIFVMGDNRNASTDSRSNSVGMVDERCVIGKVYVVAIPGSSEGDPMDWSRFGNVY